MSTKSSDDLDNMSKAALLKVLESIDRNTEKVSKMTTLLAKDNTPQLEKLYEKFIERIQKIDAEERKNPVLKLAVDNAMEIAGKFSNITKSIHEDSKKESAAQDIKKIFERHFNFDNQGKLIGLYGNRGFES